MSLPSTLSLVVVPPRYVFIFNDEEASHQKQQPIVVIYLEKCLFLISKMVIGQLLLNPVNCFILWL